MRRTLWVVLYLLLFPHLTAARQDNRTVDLNGGLQAQMLSLDEDHSTGRSVIAATVKISNTEKDDAFLLLYGPLSAVDNAGIKFDGLRGDSVTGIAECRMVPPERCIGIPEGTTPFPLQSYTEIDAGKSITVHLRLTSYSVMKGERVSLSTQLAYRLAADNDADMNQRQKLQRVRVGNLGFEPLAPRANALSSPSLPSPARPMLPGDRARAPVLPSPSPPASAPYRRPERVSPVVADFNRFKSIIDWGLYAGTGIAALILFVLGVREWRKAREWTGFIGFVCMVFLLGGAWAWVHYFGDHGMFWTWPVIVLTGVFLLAIIRAVVLDRQQREYAEELKRPPEIPAGSGPARRDDFKDW